MCKSIEKSGSPKVRKVRKKLSFNYLLAKAPKPDKVTNNYTMHLPDFRTLLTFGLKN